MWLCCLADDLVKNCKILTKYVRQSWFFDWHKSQWGLFCCRATVTETTHEDAAGVKLEVDGVCTLTITNGVNKDVAPLWVTFCFVDDEPILYFIIQLIFGFQTND